MKAGQPTPISCPREQNLLSNISSYQEKEYLCVTIYFFLDKNSTNIEDKWQNMTTSHLTNIS